MGSARHPYLTVHMQELERATSRSYTGVADILVHDDRRIITHSIYVDGDRIEIRLGGGEILCRVPLPRVPRDG